MAIGTYEKAIKRFPKDASVHVAYCSFFGWYMNRPGFSNSLNLQVDVIAKVCDRAIELSPNKPEPLELLGAIYTLMAQYDKAIEIFDTWLTQFGDKLSESKVASAKSNMALTLIRSGNYERAWDMVSDTIKIDPSYNSYSRGINIRSIGWPMDKLAWSLGKQKCYIIGLN